MKQRAEARSGRVLHVNKGAHLWFALGSKEVKCMELCLGSSGWQAVD